MSDVQSLAQDLLYYCKSTTNWTPDLTDGPVRNLLEVLSTHGDFECFFDAETAYQILAAQLRRPELQSRTAFSYTEADRVLSAVRDGLIANAARHWIVVPLRNAELTMDIRLRDFIFIAGSRDDKVDTLRRLSQISPVEARHRASHTEQSRSPGFFEHPLLAIRTHHQTSYVQHVARYWPLWAICCLQAMYWGYVYPDDRYPVAFPLVRQKCQHLAIYAKDGWRFRHQALLFKAECRFNLDWVGGRSHRKRFTQLFRSVVVTHPRDDLTYRFFRALRLFGKAMDSEESQEVFEGMGITLLYLMIAAEAVLLRQHHAKRTRLTVLLPRLANLPGHELGEQATAVDQGYRWRSDFVHAGTDKYPDWQEDFSAGPAMQSVTLLKRMVGRLLSDAPKHIERMRRRRDADQSTPETRWFEFLQDIWERALGLS